MVPVLPFELFVPPPPLPSLPFFDAFKSWSAFAAFSAGFFRGFFRRLRVCALNLLFVVVVPPLLQSVPRKRRSLPDEKSNRFIAPGKEPGDKNDSDDAFFVVALFKAVVKHLSLLKLFIAFEFTKISFRTTRDDDDADFPDEKRKTLLFKVSFALL